MIKVLLVVALFAALVYTLVWTIERRRALGGRRPRRSGPARYVAPDDDEDFLRSLEDRDKDDPENPRQG